MWQRKNSPQKSLLGSLRKIIGRLRYAAQRGKKFGKSRKSSKDCSPRRDMLAPFQLTMLDLDPLVEAESKIHPYVDEGAEVDEDIPSEALEFDEDELDVLPFDTSARS